MTSVELINVLAELGYGTCHQGPGDKRRGMLHEWGKFTKTGVCFARIVVRLEDERVYEYGAKVFIEKYE